MTKQCGNCIFYEIEKAMNSPHFANRKIAACKYPMPISAPKTAVYEDQGHDCPVYAERKE